MADPYGFDTGLPPEIEAQARALARRQKMAEAMMARSQQPLQGGMAGRFFVPPSPLQGVAQMVQAYVSGKGMEDADKHMSALGGKVQNIRAEEVAKYFARKNGVPASSESIIDEQANDGEGAPATINAPAVQADPKGAITQAMLSRNPMLQQLGKMDYQASKPVVLGKSLIDPNSRETIATDTTWQAEQAEGREARAEQARLQREQRIQEIEMRLQDARLAREDRAALQTQLQAERLAAQRDLRTLAAGLRQPPAPVPVTIADPNDPNKTIVIDGRTRQPFGAGPKLTEAGKLDAKRNFNAQGFGEIVSEAERVLTDKAKPPTGSGAGALWDKAAGFVGVTPAGAAEAQDLKAIGAALVAKMPRMEGPQSDKDVALYKEAAAEIGDPTIPVERRVKALGTVKRLYSQYEKGARQPERRGLPSQSDIDAELARRQKR